MQKCVKCSMHSCVQYAEFRICLVILRAFTDHPCLSLYPDGGLEGREGCAGCCEVSTGQRTRHVAILFLGLTSRHSLEHELNIDAPLS
jgi:hypothetical protein